MTQTPIIHIQDQKVKGQGHRGRGHIVAASRTAYYFWPTSTVPVSTKTLIKQEAQLMLTTGSTRLAVSRCQQTWYHSTCYIWFPIVQ